MDQIVHQMTQLIIRLSQTGADLEETDELTVLLQRELLQLDVEAVNLIPAEQSPPGAKGIDPGVAGILLVNLLTSSGVLVAVVKALQAWLSRQQGRSVKIEVEDDTLELTGISSQDQHRLIEAWIRRHGER